MPAPRSDFSCQVCEEVFELPVAATRCPLNPEHELTRLWNAQSTPQVGRGHEQAQMVDKLVTPQAEHAAKLKNYRPEFATKTQGATAAVGMVPGGNFQGRSVPGFHPVISNMPGGPKPLIVGGR